MPARALGFASGLTVPGNINLTQFVGSMVSNITAANSAILGLRANITAANSAITTANVGMKTYVDTSRGISTDCKPADMAIQCGGSIPAS
jgi:hypothetical protein